MQFQTAFSPIEKSAINLPQYRGYISASGRYFQDEAGQSFLVLGQNDAITWPGLVELLEQSSMQAVEDYIKDLRAHGITVSRVMLEYAHYENGLLENPIGVYSDAVVKFWDEFIPLCEKHGLYLLLTPYDTFWQVANWATYPYNAEVGGPCVEKRDWLTSKAVIDAQKARWEFVIRRWGGSPNIFAWDLMNEIELYWGCTADEMHDYITEMAAFVRETEMKVWGRTHLLSVSAATPVPNGKFGHSIYNHPALDFANTHLYVGLGVRDPLDTVECAPEMIEGVQLSLQSIFDTRPYFDSESGPIDVWIEDLAFDKVYHHNMSWAHLASGAAGSGMRWPYTNPHWLLPEFRENLLGMARFASTIDWARFESRNVASRIRVNHHDIIKTGCASEDMAVIWLLADTRDANAPSLSEITVKLAHVLKDGKYEIELWETYTGEVITRMIANSLYNKMSFTLPNFDFPLHDVAIVIRPLE